MISDVTVCEVDALNSNDHSNDESCNLEPNDVDTVVREEFLQNYSDFEHMQIVNVNLSCLPSCADLERQKLLSEFCTVPVLDSFIETFYELSNLGA
jgi:hypothetical protein